MKYEQVIFVLIFIFFIFIISVNKNDINADYSNKSEHFTNYVDPIDIEKIGDINEITTIINANKQYLENKPKTENELLKDKISQQKLLIKLIQKYYQDIGNTINTSEEQYRQQCNYPILPNPENLTPNPINFNEYQNIGTTNDKLLLSKDYVIPKNNGGHDYFLLDVEQDKVDENKYKSLNF